jgi:hypothetical protein
MSCPKDAVLESRRNMREPKEVKKLVGRESPRAHFSIPKGL